MDDSSSRFWLIVRWLPPTESRPGDFDDCRGVPWHGSMRRRFVDYNYYTGYACRDLHGHGGRQVGKLEPPYRAYSGRSVSGKIG